ncbi:hypothetical protein [Acidianus brierleyi]|uniref:Uncharacterized protein n=1 Tax=Acidianus brierleyi TaxID=41673 RepID=A0A2U9IG34_9CREN|nr:hypothetical protein [Acidianus brierleyi]AWR95022.1 hypothetical protein DFR85_10860 [Acidianus brierleyi]
MPFVTEDYGVCYPGEKINLKKGDIIAVKPFLTNTRYNLVFPPLSILSTECNRKLFSTIWVDGVKINGKEQVIMLDGNIEVSGEIEVLSPEMLAAYTAKKILGNTKLRIDDKNHGIIIIGIENKPIISVNNRQVIIHTKMRQEILVPLAYSVFYFISSEYSEEI